MTTYHKILYIVLFFAGIFMISCEEYLDKTLEADITEDKVFSTFPTFQGFVEKMYYDVVDYTTATSGQLGWDYGDELVWATNLAFHTGDLWSVGSPYSGSGSRGIATGRRVWGNGWAGIRDANNTLARLGMLVNATAEEKQLLEGQAYFFRAYLHWEIMKQWGGIPYIDTVFSAFDEMRVPQSTFDACAAKVLADFEKAAERLPIDWDQTVAGQTTYRINRGRLTKGMALSFIAQVHLWRASPLINGITTGNYTYNLDHCQKAAAAAWKVIELANQGIYTLEPWGTYSDLFKKNDRTEPGMCSEVIFKSLWTGENARWTCMKWILPHTGGEVNYEAPTQNLIDLFEMQATGLPIDDPDSGFDPANPWVGLDPRFYFSIITDGERIVLSRNDANAFTQFYSGGRDRVTAAGSQTGYGFKKFTFTNWNSFDNQWGSNGLYCLPLLRLAEIYLFYAEAVNEAYGPAGKDPNANLTAIDAVNLIRARAQMPDVHSKFTGSKEAFRERIRNERSIELVEENKRRDDLRRWYIGHEAKYKDLYGLDFPQDHSYFERKFIKSIVFSQKHYWLPFPTAQVKLYEGWKQNPGW